MARLNCFSRKQPPGHDPPVPSRPVYQLHHRPRAEIIKPNLQANVVEINQPPVHQHLYHEQLQNAMNNTVRRGAAGGGNVPPVIQNRTYIEISDDEDFDDEVALMGPAAQRYQRLAVQRNDNNRAEASPLSTPSPPPAAYGNGAQPGANVAPNTPRQAYPGIPAGADLAPFVIEDGDDLDVNDPYLAGIMMEGFTRERNEQAARPPRPSNQPPPIRPSSPPAAESRVECIDQVVAVFPGICRDHVSELYNTMAQTSDFLIGHILQQIDNGTPYPKAKDTKTLKRKREVDEDEEATRKYSAADRIVPDGHAIRQFIRSLLSKDFPETPMSFIDVALNQSGYRLFSTYRILEEANRTFDAQNPPYNKIKKQNKTRKMDDMYRDPNLEMTIQRMSQSEFQHQDAEVLRELQAARRIRKKTEGKRDAEVQAEIEEERNILRAEAEGTMSECGCCFGDYPLNRMVHCESDQDLHWFCRRCAKQNADTEIGNSKYELCCMSMDGCDAGFSIEQRNQFLDETTIIALNRNEQEAVLRMAGIENLASCPFCPYAAEYPPIEINREFRCQAPDCEKTSCRLCKLESHIPKSCEEHAKDNGLSIRRQIEEAMSAALIRKCNKCDTPFVKEEGCNKMTCTRNGCRNVQCYVCSKSCGYDHFDDQRRGGKTGNCPLFESVEDRHDNEVKKAEKEALDKVRAEHPEYTEEDLKIKLSENVKMDDERRKANDPRNPARVVQAGGGLPARYGGRLFPYQPAPPYIGLAAGPQPPQILPMYQRRPLPVPYFQEFQEDYVAEQFDDDQMIADFWDKFPGLGLEVQGVYPPPPPGQGGVQVLPHRAPQVFMNQPYQAGAPAGPGQNRVPAALPRNPNMFNFVPPPQAMPLAGAQLFQNLARRSHRVVVPPNPPQPAPPSNPYQPMFNQQDPFQQIRNNVANLQQLARGNPPAPPAAPRPDYHEQMLQAIDSEYEQRLREQNQRLHAIQQNIGDAAQMPGVGGGRVGRHGGRGPARPLNPNGQA